MSYGTWFELYVTKDGHEISAEVEKEMATALNDVIWGDPYTADHFYNIFDDVITWYDHFKDMKMFSERYPGYLFRLEGQGEDSDDVWREWFLDGKGRIIRLRWCFLI